MISLNLKMDDRYGEQYKCKSQKIRAITETWAESNMFCPYCGIRFLFLFEMKQGNLYVMQHILGSFTKNILQNCYFFVILQSESKTLKSNHNI